MSEHRELRKYVGYGLSLESIARLMARRFPDSAVVIIRPSARVRDHPSLCLYSHFLPLDAWGCVEAGAYTLHPSHCASLHVSALLSSLCPHLMHDVADVSSRLRLTLVAYSKGVVVCNQLIAELATIHQSFRASDYTWDSDEIDAPVSELQAAVRKLWRHVEIVHHVDGGNGMEVGAFPALPSALMMTELARLGVVGGAIESSEKSASCVSTRVRLAVHGTPYQWSKRGHRIELQAFVQSMRAHAHAQLRREVDPESSAYTVATGTAGTDHVHESVVLKSYFHDEPPSLRNHVRILREFDIGPC